jgi:hypothetical protein
LVASTAGLAWWPSGHADAGALNPGPALLGVAVCSPTTFLSDPSNIWSLQPDAGLTLEANPTNNVYGLACDPSGGLLAYSYNQVEQLGPDGGLTVLASQVRPSGLASDPSTESIYFGDAVTYRLLRLSPSGVISTVAELADQPNSILVEDGGCAGSRSARGVVPGWFRRLARDAGRPPTA